MEEVGHVLRSRVHYLDEKYEIVIVNVNVNVNYA